MAFERRLKPLPKTFAYEESPASPCREKGRSWSFSDYVPFDFQSEEESVSLWPDTDDEERFWKDDRKEDASTRSLTLPQGSPRSEVSSMEVDSPCIAGLSLSEMVLATSPAAAALPPTLLADGRDGRGYAKEAAAPDFYDVPFSPMHVRIPPSFHVERDATSPTSEDPRSPTGDSDATTLMIRNLPKSLSQSELLQALNQAGMAGLYDFCYLPRDFSSSESKGYAFVNFLSPEVAQMFRKSFHRKHFLGGQQTVIFDAAVQGLEANLRSWCPQRLNRIRNPELKPWVANMSGQLRALETGAMVLQKARAIMPAVDLKPTLEL